MSREFQGTASLLEVEDYLLLAPVVLLPWAFGGVEIWAYRTAALLLVAAASVCLWKRGVDGLGLVRPWGWLLPAFLLGLWGALQILPMPPAAIGLLSPTAHRLYAEAFPGFSEPAGEGALVAFERRALERVEETRSWPPPAEEGPPVGLSAPECLERRWRTLSLEPGATADRLAWYVALLLGFLVARDRVSSRHRRRAYRWVLFATFGALALFSLVQMQMWNGKIYWVRQVLTLARPFGPYFNPTNLAGVMELALPALAGFAWTRLRRNGRAALYEGAFAATAAGAAFCLAAGVASASKLAVALLVTGLVALGLLGARTIRMRLAVGGAAVVALSIGGLLISGTRLGERLEQFVGRPQDAMLLEGRLVVWQASGEMFRDFPITGSGFGSFAEVFTRYLPAGASNLWSHAHNDYLEVLLGGGLVAALLVLWLLAGFVRQVIRSVPSVEPISPGRLGLIIGVVSLAIHALFDFNHQIPANALLWLLCCALLVPVNRRKRRREEAS